MLSSGLRRGTAVGLLYIMIIDEVTIQVSAGDGGAGKVSFRREKYVAKGGPDGGNGGKGGDVYFFGVSDLAALRQFRHNKNVIAADGDSGGSKNKFGSDGKDISIRIPVGTKILDSETGETWELADGEKALIAKCGRGGRGNFEFRSHQNQTPRNFEEGKLGKKRTLLLNLQYIADVGLIGLPSAGKSSLLNVLTKAEVKVGDYPFTTLEANLGEMDGTIIADIPGLIEGAHLGKGLGIRFLKHIEKTKLLVHCIDITSPEIVKDYHSIREELRAFNEKLLGEKEIIVLTKSDLVDSKKIKDQIAIIQKYNHHLILSLSILDPKKIASFKKLLQKELKLS